MIEEPYCIREALMSKLVKLNSVGNSEFNEVLTTQV
jgi:hypothetical protein